jgi:hypothetical protein
MAWTCPSCGREFARARQSHGCSPALTLDEYFSTGPAFERPIFDAVAAHLMPLGDVRVEAVQVGIFFKKARTFVELRPMRDRVRLSMLFSRDLEDRRVVKRLGLSGRRFAVYVDLRTPDEVDDQLTSWLTESCLSSPD